MCVGFVPRPTRLDFEGGSDGQNSESGAEVQPRSEKRQAPPPPDKRPEKPYPDATNRSDNVTKVPVRLTLCALSLVRNNRKDV